MKKVSKVLLSLVICLISLVYFSKPVSASSINNLNFDVYIDENGTAEVTQTWEGVFTEGTEVYQAYNNMNGSTIDEFSVTDTTKGTTYTNIGNWNVNASFADKAYKCGIVNKSNGYELCFGISSYGGHTFTMKYKIHNFVTKYKDGVQGINWRLVSENLKPMPEKFSISIKTSVPFTNDNTDIYGFGYQGRCVFQDGAIVMNNTTMDDEEIGKVNYANILAKIDSPIYTGYKESTETYEEVLSDAKEGSSYDSDENGSSYYSNGSFLSRFPWMFAAIIIGVFTFLTGLVVAFFRSIFKNSYTTKLRYADGSTENINQKDVDYFREIPCNGGLFYYYYIVVKNNVVDEETAKSGLLSALLLRWIRNGDLDFEREEGTGFFKKDKYEIDFHKEIETHNKLEDQMIGYFREASGSNQVLEDKEFAKWCRKNYDILDGWFERLMSFQEGILHQRGLSKQVNIPRKVLFMNFSDTVEEYSLEFKEEVKHVVGFKKFVKEFTLLDEKQVQEVKLWEDYLIFASVIGMADKVEDQIGKLYPDFNRYSNIDYHYTTYATRMYCYAGIHSAVNAQARANSSSRSFGGGGGSSFGGGGGSFSGGGGGGIR